MYVTRVQLRNVKGFSGKRAVDLRLEGKSGWTVLAGRNSSGKSTVLQAIALALCGPGVARSLVTDFTGWVTTGAKKGEVEVHVTHEPSLDGFVGPGNTPQREISLGLRWTPPSTEQDHGARPVLDTLTPRIKNGPRGPWAENPVGWFYAGYGPFRRLTGGSSEAQRLMMNQGPRGRLATLFHEDASLAEGVAWLIDLRLRAFEEGTREGVAEGLLDIVLDLLGDGLLPDQYQIQRVTADGLWVAETGKEGRRFPLKEMSDGYRTVAALVLDIVRQLHHTYGSLSFMGTGNGGLAIASPGVVLIDEVDAHLHVTWQRKIGDWLQEHFPNIQFIVTSHSPYICQAADPRSLIRLPGVDEQQPAAVVDDDLYRRVVYGSGDDAVLSELFGLETPYSSRAEQQRRRLVALESKVYAETASEDEITEYHNLAELLTSSLSSRVAEVSARLEQDR
ncbi:AAA family ATPase [Kitasatospora sp. CB01950]|uniref:AAA family ATPase n=1 Tax=Kitasatospora sp. CB01950 TaxID=1703930 RepID=UPI00093FC986|nr:ATP-binding protein [Kitasatospora sp. CB01950]OKJ06680.1 AAA family ATPase [Kitasatospora sp. CB01950]